MPALKRKKLIGVKWVNHAQAHEMLEKRARSVLNIGADQFVSNWGAGKYRKLDSDECPGVIELALLAPLPKIRRGRKKSKRSSR